MPTSKRENFLFDSALPVKKEAKRINGENSDRKKTEKRERKEERKKGRKKESGNISKKKTDRKTEIETKSVTKADASRSPGKQI